MRRLRFVVALFAVFVTVLGVSSPGDRAEAQTRPAASLPDFSLPHAENTLLVGFQPGSKANERAAAARSAGVAAASAPVTPADPNLERWTVSPGTKLEDVAKNLLRNPNVRFAEPDYFVTKSVVPNDTYYTSGSLWGMYGAGTSTVNLFGSRAGDAWAAGYTGSSDIYVGIIDEGVQYTHPDLAANMWVNTAEISDGIDNDGNGYIDDVNGWDFFNNDNSVFDAGGDDHGTHVAGTIGGVGGNGIGVVGVNWNVKMIPAKFLGPSGGYLSDAILAMDYLTDLKTRKNINLVAVNNSWGGGDYTQSMADAIDRMGDAGILFIAAAGNEATDTDAGSHYPSRYECTKGGTRGWDCVVSVAAIDSTGALAYFSNWGNNSVDLGAPGVSINSTVSVDSYAAYSGTSMATPHVTGAVALCASANPTLAPRLIREALLGSARATTSLAGKTVTGARLDANALVSACRPQAAAPSGTASGLAATATGISHASLAWTDGITGETGYEVQTALGTVAACGQFGLGVIIPAGATSFGASGLQPGTDYCFRVRGVNNFSGGSSSAWSAIASAKTLPAPAPYSCAATTYSWLDAVTGGTSYALADDGSVLVTLPFTVNSYGASYTQARIAANGFLRLGSGTATQFLNQTIPLIDDTNGMIAVAWDDWNPAGGGSIWAKTLGTAPNRTYVVSWVGIPNFNVSGSAATFQVAISEGSGAVTLQYQDMALGNSLYNAGASATAGIEGPTGEYGTLISYNAASLTDLKAYRCTDPANAGVAPTITGPGSLDDATTGQAYSASILASGGSTPYTWSISGGALPAGISLNASTGVLGGNPTTAGTYSFTVKVAASDGAFSTQSYSLVVGSPLAVSTTSVNAATAGVSFSQTLASTGGKAPITWSVASGTLPAGVTLSSSGVLSGVPTEAGAFTFSVTATDSRTPTARTASKSFTMNVAFGKASPVNNATLVRGTTSTTLRWYAHTGATQYRYCVNTSNKTCTTWVTVASTSTTATASGLGNGKSYYWQVQALVNGTWVGANGTTMWKFTVSR